MIPGEPTYRQRVLRPSQKRYKHLERIFFGSGLVFNQSWEDPALQVGAVRNRFDYPFQDHVIGVIRTIETGSYLRGISSY